MKENKQTRTDRLFEQIKPELLKTLSNAPSFGISQLILHFMDGKVKRVVHKREESIIPGTNTKGAVDFLAGGAE